MDDLQIAVVVLRMVKQGLKRATETEKKNFIGLKFVTSH